MKTTPLVIILFHSTFFLTLSTTSGAATYTNPEKHFSFVYNEADWEVVSTPKDPEKPGSDVDHKMDEKTLVTIQRKVADEKYRARVSVVLDNPNKAKGKETNPLKRYQDYAVGFLKNQRFTVVSSNLKNLKGSSEEVSDVVAYQRDFGLTFHQLIFLHKDEAYLLTAATRTTKYESYAQEIEKIFESFHFSS